MIYSFLYIIVSAISFVLIQKLDINLPPLFLLFIASIITVLYFNAINITKLKAMYQACWQHKKLWFSIMISILIMWSCAMFAPGLIGASLYGFLYFACLGSIGFISLSLQDWKKNYQKFYCAMCILVLMVASIVFELKFSFTSNILLGIAISLLGGIVTFVYFKQSQAAMKAMHLGATQILAVRFYLTILVTFAILPQHSMAHYFTLTNALNLVLLAFVSMIVPIYLGQKALEKITAEQNSIIVSLCPAATSILQAAVFHDVTLQQGIIYMLYSLTLASFYFVSKFNKKQVVSA